MLRVKIFVSFRGGHLWSWNKTHSSNKKVKKQKSNQVLLLQIVLTYLLPSVVDVSEAGIQRTVVISKNRFKNKNQIKYYIFKQCWDICYLL